MGTYHHFTKDPDNGEPRTWHLFEEHSFDALCGEAKLAGSVDDTTDVVPAQDTVHLACREALAAIEQPKAEAEAAEYAAANPEPEAEAAADGDGEPAADGEPQEGDHTDAVVEGGEVPAEGEAPAEGEPAEGEPVADGAEEVAPQ